MNSQTKILVIHKRELYIALGIIAVLILFLALLFITASKNNTTSNGQTGSRPAKSSKTTSATAGNLSSAYSPGKYTSSMMLNGNSLDICITVDKYNITNIELQNIPDSVKTMYPTLEESFNEIAEKVIEKNTIENITYESENRYTSTVILNAISQALDKCTIK